MSAAPIVPPTRVLAVASHVVSGNVGNKVAVFALQSLGCDVAALNTVQFSNHTAYRQWRGTKVSAAEIQDLYEGLKENYLDDFDMMLSGYVPGAEAVAAVGNIARELKENNKDQPGKFFWVLDPVMGDNGRLYVSPEVVPEYKGLLQYADLILPNQFEAELLSDVKITDMDTLKTAIRTLHKTYNIPHIVITSISIPGVTEANHLRVVGSTMTSTNEPRLFQITFPAIDCYFCGTGDMFGALITCRIREAALAVPDLSTRQSWLSDDTVSAEELPLAKAAEKVLASMHEVLTRTKNDMPASIEKTRAGMSEEDKNDEKKAHFVKTKAAELQLVRNLDCLRSPQVQFTAKKL